MKIESLRSRVSENEKILQIMADSNSATYDGEPPRGCEWLYMEERRM